MLSVTDLHVYYGAIHALKGLSLTVNQGEIVTLIGANGAGKSTTLRTISGLIVPRGGDITFEGSSIAGNKAHEIVRRGISQVPEGRRIFADMTVMENLELGAFTRSDADGIAADMETVFGRVPRLKERRLDEPSMGLAPLLIKEIFSIIVDINAAGTTVLLVEQNANMALSIAHRAYVLETGRITLAGDAKDLAASEDVRKAYLGG